MRIAPLVLLAALPLPWIPWQPHLPAWAERWIYNPRERTEQTIAAYREGDGDRAVATSETAHRLAPDDPLTGYNAGTANLAAGRARKAAKLLEQAAKGAPSGLAPTAWYNLGNARLAASDPAAAVEAYKQALLRNPADGDAKHNLEIALQQREQQRLRTQGGRQGSRGDRSGEREQSKKPGEGSPSADKRRAPQDPGRGKQGQQQSQGKQGQQDQPSQQGGGRLPNFKNQPEMSSREAANLLSAVEDLERRQRRDEAAKRSKQKALKGKDW
jgi:tetratricopeptide (TPR) repeat protein